MEKILENRDKQLLAEIKDKRIAVLLSGGVDSSVVVWEFARLGLHPDCFYIKIGPEEEEEWGLLFRGRPRDGHFRGTQIRIPARSGGLPQGVLGPGDALHDGQGESRLHAQPRRDVQPPHQVRCIP